MSRPRIRTLKPDLWQDEKIGGLSRDARLLFIGLVTMADDEGRLRALPALILGHVYPYDTDALKKVAGWLEEIITSGLVHRYEVAGTPYMQLIGWRKHQKINRPTKSEVPPPSLTEAVVKEHGANTVASPPEGIGRDRNGSPPRPPDGGRKREHSEYRGKLRVWASEEVPDLDPDLVVGVVSRLRTANVPESEITSERIRARAASLSVREESKDAA